MAHTQENGIMPIPSMKILSPSKMPVTNKIYIKPTRYYKPKITNETIFH